MLMELFFLESRRFCSGRPCWKGEPLCPGCSRRSAHLKVAIHLRKKARRFTRVVAVALIGFGHAVRAQPYFEQDITATDPLRIEQARELDAYIKTQARDRSSLAAIFQPDYTSPEAFVRSAEAYRAAFTRAIGYPPPGESPTLFRDSDLVALICPRPLQLQAGMRDAVHPEKPGVELAAAVANF